MPEQNLIFFNDSPFKIVGELISKFKNLPDDSIAKPEVAKSILAELSFINVNENKNLAELLCFIFTNDSFQESEITVNDLTKHAFEKLEFLGLVAKFVIHEQTICYAASYLTFLIMTKSISKTKIY